MRAAVAWSDRAPERDGVKSVCYDIAFRPDGLQLVAAVGSRVLVYDATDGDLVHSLKGHRDAVYAVSYSRDGKRFASGGADRNVIIWTSRGEGVLRYNHADSVQSLAYNPVSGQLASATATDFGLWSPEQKAVSKHRVSSRALCCSWTPDGEFLALGLYEGAVTIRDRGGAEKCRIERPGGSPVWTLAFNPVREEGRDVLAVGCWDGTLSLYTLAGQQLGSDRPLGWDPCCAAYFNQGEFLLLAGTGRAVTLATTTGVLLQPVCERPEAGWLWVARHRPKANCVAVGGEDGSVTMYQLTFSTVHGLYRDRYAFREAMTDVVVQHLLTEQKVRLRMNDYVKKIAVYKDRLAVQLSDSIRLFAAPPSDDPAAVAYVPAGAIPRKLDCSLLVVTSRHVVLCLERALALYSFAGAREREWVLDSTVRYIKVMGGPPGGEGLLVGLRSGAVVRVFVDNPFSQPLVKHPAPVRCLDLSAGRARLAVVDDTGAVCVYDARTGGRLWEEKGANSVAWNSELEEMLSWSGGGQLAIRTGDFPPSVQRLQGFVVGLRGSKVFCLHYVAMQTVDVPQSAAMFRYLERRQYERAHRCACLGVTPADWRALALDALQHGALAVARAGFTRLRDWPYLGLVARLEAAVAAAAPGGEAAAAAVAALGAAEALAFAGRYGDAASAFAAAGRPDLAAAMYADLRRPDDARLWGDRSVLAGGAAAAGARGLVSPVAARLTSVGASSPAGAGAARKLSTVGPPGSPQAGSGDAPGAAAGAGGLELSEAAEDVAGTVDLYMRAGKLDRAVALIAGAGAGTWAADRLMDVVRAATTGGDAGSAGARALASCAALLRKWGRLDAAREALTKLGDHKQLAALAVEAGRWEEARALAAAHPELAGDVYLPYARSLAAADRFDEALSAYRQAGRLGEADRLLEGLMRTAVSEGRIRDASFYYWQLAREAARAGEPATKFLEHYSRAEMYFAFATIRQAQEEPFMPSATPETLVNMARFLLLRINERGAGEELPYGISMAYILRTIAKWGGAIGAYNLSRWAYDRMHALRLPAAWRDVVELDALAARARPAADDPDCLPPVCWRCGGENPLVPAERQGDVCIVCRGRFHRSFLTFVHLPLVEFVPAPGISEDEAMALLDEAPPASAAVAGRLAPRAPQPLPARAGGGGPAGFDPLSEAGALLDDRGALARGGGGGGGGVSGDGPFARAPTDGSPVVLDREALRALPRAEVLVRTWPGGVLPTQFFAVRDPELYGPLCVDESGHFYEAEEYDAHVLERGSTPFCRTQPEARPAAVARSSAVLSCVAKRRGAAPRGAGAQDIALGPRNNSFARR